MQHPKPEIVVADRNGNQQMPTSESSTSSFARQLHTTNLQLSNVELAAKLQLATRSEMTSPTASHPVGNNTAIDYNRPQQPIVLVTGKQFDTQASISRSARYERLDPRSPRFDPTFPKPIKLSATSIRFLQSEVNAWIASRVEASRRGKKTGR